MIKKFNPTLLQGNIGKQNYFEGWFQKIYSPEHDTTFIIIYGFATGNDTENKGFIQLYIPENKVIHLNFHENQIVLDKNNHNIKFGENIISNEQIYILTDKIQINLSIHNQEFSPFKHNSMGLYYLVPNLPCYHSVLHKSSTINGIIIVDETKIELNNTIGYLEKSWGTSFPDKYFWMHAQDPTNLANQVLFSQAEIIWKNKTFIKHFGYLLLDGKYVNLGKIHRKNITSKFISNKKLSISLNNLGIILNYNLNDEKRILFKSPIHGKMSNQITHNTEVSIIIKNDRNPLINNILLKGNVENSFIKKV